MATPDLASVHVDAILSDTSFALFQDEGSFVARAASPLIPTQKQTNKYFIYDKENTMRSDAARRAPGTETHLRDYTLSQDQYHCELFSVGHNISEQNLANQDDPLDEENDTVAVLTEDILIRMEQDWASAFFTTSVWTTDDTNENWADDASDPIQALLTGANTMRGLTGRMPNTLILGADAWNLALANHPDLLSRIPSNLPAIMTQAFLGSLIGVDRVLVGGSIRNTAAENLAFSATDNLGANALLAFVTPNPGRRAATSMATFNWTGLAGMNNGIRVLRQEIPEQDAFPRITVEAAFDYKVVNADLGVFFSAVTT